MVDNVPITAGAGTNVASDDIGGVHYQRVKCTFGADGTATDVSATARMPVEVSQQNTRVTRHFFMNTYTVAPLVEAMMLVEQWYNNAAVVATVSPAVVPAGKRLRLQGVRLSSKSLASAGSVVLRVRCNTAGTAVIASPIVATFEVGSLAAVAGLLGDFCYGFPDGIEIPAAAGVGFSLAGYNATGVLALQGVTRFDVWGIEYSV